MTKKKKKIKKFRKAGRNTLPTPELWICRESSRKDLERTKSILKSSLRAKGRRAVRESVIHCAKCC